MIAGAAVRALVVVPLSLALVPSLAYAQSDIRLSADASADIGYSANPFQQPGSDAGSAFAQVRVRPQVKLVNERSTFVLAAPADYQRYFKRYGDNWDYGALLDYSGTPSARVKTHAYFTYDSSIIGRGNQGFGLVDPTLPEIPVQTGTDIALFGTRDRRQTIRGGGDVSVVLSARDSLSLAGYYTRSRYKQFGALGDNDGYGGSAGYSRRINERLQLGAQGSVARYDYRGTLGDTTVYSPQLSFSATLGLRWKADGAIGASFVQRSVGGDSTALSGNLRLCRETARSAACLNAQRAVLPTGISGTQNTTSLGATYSYKVSEFSTLLAAADYTKNGFDQLTAFGQNEYFRGSLGYQRRLKERLRLILSGQYRKTFGGVFDRGTDYGGQIGLAIGLGDNR